MNFADSVTARAAIASMLVLAAAVSGCQRGERTAPAAASAADGGATQTASTAKLNGYIRAHDILVGGAGLEPTRRSYESALVEARRKGATPGFTPGWFDHAVAELRKARALPGADLAALDTTGDELVRALEPLHAMLVDVGAYYDSKAYLEDDFAKAKTRYAPTLAAFNTATAAADAFYVALEQATSAATTRRLEALKASGDVLAYELALSMSRAKALLRAVQVAAEASPAAPATGRRAGKAAPSTPDYTAADAVLQSLEQSLGAARSELARRKAAATADLGSSPYSEQASVVDTLARVAGAYRSFKSTGRRHEGEVLFMVYNQAVDYYNRIPTRQFRPVGRQ